MSSHSDSLPEYDVVVPMKPAPGSLERAAVRNLLRFLDPRRIYIVGSSHSLDAVRRWRFPRIHSIHEDELIEGVSLEKVRAMQSAAGRDPGRAGWYFQQLLKFGAGLRDEVLEHYLVWDSDTVLLRPIELFGADGRIFVTTRRMTMMESYRLLAQDLLGREIAPTESCISEQMLFRKTWLREMLSLIERTGSKGESWALRIMNEVVSRPQPEHWFNFLKQGVMRDYTGSWDFGFSEFETYASYLRFYHPDEIRFRTLSSDRHGSGVFGLRPNRFDLDYLGRYFDYVSFEPWSLASPGRIRKNKRRALRWSIARRTPFGSARELPPERLFKTRGVPVRRGRKAQPVASTAPESGCPDARPDHLP